MAAPTLVFDLDGTLSDPAEGIGRSLNHALTLHGYPEIPATAFGSCVGPGLDVSFQRWAGDLPEPRLKALVAAYRDRYATVGLFENVLYPGIPEALQALTELGVPLGVCTTKLPQVAERILVHFGLRHHFDFVSGGDVGIPKSRQLGELLEAGRIDARATMIGDRDLDIAAGRAHGLRTVGVLWGHGGRAELERAGADHLVASPRELPQLADASSGL